MVRVETGAEADSRAFRAFPKVNSGGGNDYSRYYKSLVDTGITNVLDLASLEYTL